MKHSLLLFFSFLGAITHLFGQEPASPGMAYKGLRLSLFHFETVKETPHTLLLRCDVANTGRYAVAFGKKQKPPAALVVELDTLNLPRMLLGWEERVSAAFLQAKIDLQPGEIFQGLLLQVSLDKVLSAGETSPLPVAGTGQTTMSACGDLAFDTAFVVRRQDKKLLLRYILYNRGDAPILLEGKRHVANIALNVYFVRGAKLTRGAILATGTFLPPGPDLHNGYLAPGQHMTVEIEIDLRKRTRFAPNLVLEVNPSQTVKECSMTNNTVAVPLDF